MAHVEERMLAWGGVPAGSTLELQVNVGQAVVDLMGACTHEPTKGNVRKFTLSTAQLADRAFTVPVTRGSFFQMFLEMTYLAPAEQTITVTAAVLDAGGGVVNDPETGQPFEFSCDYSGKFGGANGQDHVTIFVGGGK